jgi:hypothetical protein
MSERVHTFLKKTRAAIVKALPEQARPTVEARMARYLPRLWQSMTPRQRGRFRKGGWKKFLPPGAQRDKTEGGGP